MTELLDLSAAGLCGREKEIHQLQACVQRVINSHAVEIVLIEGEAGAGKSVLAQHVCVDSSPKQARQDAFVCGMGKFEETSQEPFRAIMSCFETVITTLLESSIERDMWRIRFKKSLLKSEILEIARHSPIFLDLSVEDGQSPLKDGPIDNAIKPRSLDFLKFALRSLCRCICNYRALVLCLDDVHWADDSESAQILSTLIGDIKARNLLICTTNRPQESRLQSVLRSRNHTTIRLHPLTSKDINALLVKSTRMNDCRGLADIVLKRTGGNAMFVTRFILLMCEKGLIKRDINGSWQWMSSRIAADTEAGGALSGVLLHETQELPQDVQDCLLCAACLGQSTFNVNTLHRVMCNVEMPPSDDMHRVYKLKLEASLSKACRAGLIECTETQGNYKFIHDQVRESVRDGLLPKGADLACLYKRIGQRLLSIVDEECDSSTKNQFFLPAVHQMNRANMANPASSKVELVRLARLNAQAAELAHANGLFFTASTFCKSGLALLPLEKRWSEYYKVSLELTVVHGQSLYSMGELVECEATLRLVLEHVGNLSDQLDSYHTLIRCLLQQDRGREAIQVAREVLGKLGVTVPGPSQIKLYVLVRSLRSQALLRRKGVDFLKSLPPVRDPLMDRAFELLHLLGEVATMTANSDLHMFAMTEVVHRTLQWGASRHLVAQLMITAGQCAIFDNLEMASRVSQLSLSLINDASPPSRAVVEAKTLNNFFISHWKQPETMCLEAALKTKDFVMGSGFVDALFYAVTTYGFYYFQCGLKLDPLEHDLKKTEEMLLDFGFHNSTALLEPFLQTVQNLLGMSADPTTLTGSTMNQDEALRLSLSTKNQRASQMICMFRMILNYIFNETAESLKMSKELFPAYAEGPALMLRLRLAFQALAHYAMAHETGKVRYARRGRRFLRRLESMLARGCPNVFHYLALVRAEEFAFLHRKSRDLSAVRRMYDDAIAASGRLGVLHIQAIANERAGLFFLSRKDESERAWAPVYLTRSWSLYEEWGSLAKSQQMIDVHGDLIHSSNFWRSSSLRARERVDFSPRVNRSKSFCLDTVNKSVLLRLEDPQA